MLATLLIALTACGGGEETSPEAREAFQRGRELYEQFAYSEPVHTRFELDHQLVVRSEDPELVMTLLAIEPGMTVADIACGSGFYTPRLARAVGAEGKVWAVDIQRDAIEYLERRLRDGGMDPHHVVETRVNRVDDAMIPEASLDVALLSHADFYAYDRLLPENRRMIESVARALKPGGRLVVVQNMKVLEGASEDAIQRNFEAAGLETLLRQHDPKGNDVMFVFRRPGGDAAPAGGPAATVEAGAGG